MFPPVSSRQLHRRLHFSQPPQEFGVQPVNWVNSWVVSFGCGRSRTVRTGQMDWSNQELGGSGSLWSPWMVSAHGERGCPHTRAQRGPVSLLSAGEPAGRRGLSQLPVCFSRTDAAMFPVVVTNPDVATAWRRRFQRSTNKQEQSLHSTYREKPKKIVYL